MKLNEMRQFLNTNWAPSSMKDQETIYTIMREAGFEPGEFYQELEMDNRYVNTHPDTSFSNSTIHLHSHNFYELLCCRNTCGTEYLVGTRRYRLQKGDILFVAPGVSHRPILPEHMTEPYQRDVLWISKEYAQMLADMVPGFKNLPPPDTNLLRTAGTKWEFLADMFHAGVEEFEKQEFGWELAVMGNTTLLCTHLWRALRYQPGSQLSAEAPELLDRVISYLEAHLAEKISLSDTARHFYVSESAISHLFRQKLGVSFYRCVTQRRLIAAKELIWHGLPMDSVAEKSGFTDYSAFFRAFKQEYGISPRQYRKLQEGKEK